MDGYIPLHCDAVTYLMLTGLGLGIGVPLLLTMVAFDFQCVLYMDVLRRNETTITDYRLSGAWRCSFPVFSTALLCVIGGLPNAVCALCTIMLDVQARPKDFEQNANRSLMLRSIGLLLATLVTCCIVTIGVDHTNDSLLHYQKMCEDLRSQNCSDQPGLVYKGAVYSYAYYYTYPRVAEIAAWMVCLVFLVQIVMYLLRYVKLEQKNDKRSAPLQPILPLLQRLAESRLGRVMVGDIIETMDPADTAALLESDVITEV